MDLLTVGNLYFVQSSTANGDGYTLEAFTDAAIRVKHENATDAEIIPWSEIEQLIDRGAPTP